MPKSSAHGIPSFAETQEADPETQAVLADLLREIATELHPGIALGPIEPETMLQQELGIDSLGRTELIARVERRFEVHLQDQRIITAETVADLLGAIRDARGSAPPPRRKPIRPVEAEAGASALLPERAETLIDVLEWRAELSPAQTAVHYYDDDEKVSPTSYVRILEGARRIAAALREMDLPPKPVIAIMLPTCLEFFYSFYGILMAGGIPLPLYPPDRPSRIEEHLKRQLRILSSSGASLLIAPSQAGELRRLLKASLPELAGVVQPEALLRSRASYEHLLVRGEDIALLQYTSGSTGDPKGVILTHANLLANIRAIGQAIHPTANDVFVSWLPLYHDMGLIGACMGTLYFGVPLVLMSPLHFIARPERWLWLMHHHRGTLTAAPNFAYELCSRKIQDSQLAGLDLSSWRAAFNGAEPVSPSTLNRFAERFKKYGFAPNALTPLYGLAESTVGLTIPPIGRGPKIDTVQRDALANEDRAIPSHPGVTGAVSLVGCGVPLPKHEVRIVDESDRELPERRVGRIQFRGPSATSGYFRNPEATAKLFHSDWLDSGDYGYIAHGELFVSGRAKDMIIRGGRHIFPYEIEEAIGGLPEIRRGGVAVFGKQDPASGTEEILVIAETRLPALQTTADLQEKIREIVIEAIGVPPDDIVLAPAHSVLKTPSGKIRRADCLRLYERGKIGQTAPLWQQWIRLRAQSLAPALKRSSRRASTFGYGMYFYFLTALLSPIGMVGVLLLPRWEWRIGWAQFFLRRVWNWAGIAPVVTGVDHSKLPTPAIVVSNHASYLDSLIVGSVLPGKFRFIAKRELKTAPLVGTLMKRLDSVFVERFDPKSAREDAESITENLRAGRSIAIFPEGTFTRAPGLRSFRMGAFWAAARTGTPIVPVTIVGTRSILRDGWWLPHPGKIQIHVSTPIYPKEESWKEAIRLRDEARAEIMRHCCEPDLGQWAI